MRGRSWIAGAAVAAAVLAAWLAGVVGADLEDGSSIRTTTVLYAVTVAAGLLIWGRRGSVRMGALIVAWGAALLLSEFWEFFPDSRLLVTLLTPLDVAAAVYAHMVLAYPSGRLHDRIDRIAVWGFYAVALVPSIIVMMTWVPQPACPLCRPRVTTYLHVGWLDRQPALDISSWLVIACGVVFLALLARRVISAPRGARATLWPLGVAAVFGVVQFILAQAVQLGEWWNLVPTLDRLGELSQLAVPVAFACGTLLGERRRRGIGDHVVELGATRPGGVRDALAEAVGDPSLELLLWEPSHRRWITPEGAVAELPDASARAVTPIGDHLAAVVHDPMLADQARVIVRAGSAAWLALENERLQAELRRQLEELRASRARIVAVGDEERRRLERDLHDGAQQRLLGVGLALQLLRPRLSAPAEAEPVLAEAEDELRAALEELRELARGIHPAILTEQGLEPALRSLASRSPVHVSVETSDCGALPGEVESTVYFVAAEALTNVVKHAGASHVWLSLGRRNGAVRLVVRDDGRGGADAAGSGLVGLIDRVGALGGCLTVASGVEGGTELEAEIPCASS